ncbi:hypothetical protein P691DRAFT_809680 [Macrolepiota fuliginosa MF-IS2]|uniref:Uncharacterized protein n=1 Tax=Macrolepiota fuliginosa MF-IS2 TaxID=1400762 RepID=A0A9P6BXE1_9AGAR|nr:hypothetical protein P691DRAFT_809680 [Macrolepiota fuliginosa MF-IS2]
MHRPSGKEPVYNYIHNHDPPHKARNVLFTIIAIGSNAFLAIIIDSAYSMSKSSLGECVNR